jgi:hypothetical protein
MLPERSKKLCACSWFHACLILRPWELEPASSSETSANFQKTTKDIVDLRFSQRWLYGSIFWDIASCNQLEIYLQLTTRFYISDDTSLPVDLSFPNDGVFPQHKQILQKQPFMNKNKMSLARSRLCPYLE